MDNFELKTCIEIWKEEQEKILNIKRSYLKSKVEIEVLKELLVKLSARNTKGELSALEKPMIHKLTAQIIDADKYFQKVENEYNSRQVELMMAQEKINIIEKRMGSQEILEQEKESILKRII